MTQHYDSSLRRTSSVPFLSPRSATFGDGVVTRKPFLGGCTELLVVGTLVRVFPLVLSNAVKLKGSIRIPVHPNVIAWIHTLAGGPVACK